MAFQARIATLFVILFGAFASALVATQLEPNNPRPNVVLIMSDDQGYGDFGVMGNEVIRTPNIDALARHSASMHTFYVSPVCSPTRASLLTGRYNYRTRCIDTWLGRSMMDTQEVTIAELLSVAGYRTGVFGKWHLGDCYPMRPNDQGFDEALVHRGGGLAQPSEPRENQRRYTNPILFHNGQQQRTQGYCTDVYFQAAAEFIEQSVEQNQNFFAYIPTNAPHGPFHDVPEALRKQYMENTETLRAMITSDGDLDQQIEKLARIYAMITNIDENVGQLMQQLATLGIRDNTLVIYLNDNGPVGARAAGPFRGHKSSVYEGGVRSPLWLHWPARLAAGTASDAVAAHIDLLPTILEACGVDLPAGLQVDGRSLLPALENHETWDNRTIVIQSHRGDAPTRYHHCLVRQGPWKLVHASGFGKQKFDGDPVFELFHLENDPAESSNLASEHPELVQRLTNAYDDWFDDVSSTRPDNYAPPRIVIGSDQEMQTTLTRQDWRGESWANDRVGYWLLDVQREGSYRINCEVYRPAPFDRQLSLTIGGKTYKLVVPAGQQELEIREIIELPAGETELRAVVKSAKNQAGLYQVMIRRVLPR